MTDHEDVPTQSGGPTDADAAGTDAEDPADGPGSDATADASEAPTQIGADTDPPETGSTTWPGTDRKLHDRYQLEDTIASGGAAIVWRAFDDVLSRSVAIKLLHPHLATDEVTVERFRLESINAARLSHPNVVQIYDTGHERDVVYLVMEHVDGPSLREVLQSGGALDPVVVAALGEQVASALGEAHLQGVVHRDVKPANILLTGDGVAKVTDFGIAKALSGAQQALTNPGTVVGTAAYVAPEQLEGQQIDGRADVYALGIVLYECLTGEAAFTGDTPTATAALRLTQDLTPPRQLRANVPRELDEIVVKATRRDPDERYPDANAMAAALAQLVPAKPSEITARLVDGSARETTQQPRSLGVPSRSSRIWHTRAEYGRRLALAFLGGLVLAAVAFFAGRAAREDPAVTRTTGPGPGAAVAIAAASDYDPFGDDGEHPDEVELSFDGDVATAWTTETYRDHPRFALNKPGVGLVYDLGQIRNIEAVQLDLLQAGVGIELYAADEPHADLVAWGRPIASLAEAPEATTLTVGDAEARYWLVWITNLTPTGDNTFGAGISEISFHAR